MPRRSEVLPEALAGYATVMGEAPVAVTQPAQERQDDENDCPAGATGVQRPARSLKNRALGYLSRREHSRTELACKLAPFASHEEAGALDAVLDSLERDGWLSDARFTESVVHRRAARVGVSRIVDELKRHAVDEALIENVGARLRETELARAWAVWQKKYGQLPATLEERAKQARFLASRGFSLAITGKILKGIDESWSEQ